MTQPSSSKVPYTRNFLTKTCPTIIWTFVTPTRRPTGKNGVRTNSMEERRKKYWKKDERKRKQGFFLPPSRVAATWSHENVESLWISPKITYHQHGCVYSDQENFPLWWLLSLSGNRYESITNHRGRHRNPCLPCIAAADWHLGRSHWRSISQKLYN